MTRTTKNRLIIKWPYEEPRFCRRQERETRLFGLLESRQPAGYVVASESSKALDAPGISVEIQLVNHIPARVKASRAGYLLEAGGSSSCWVTSAGARAQDAALVGSSPGPAEKRAAPCRGGPPMT